MTFLYSSVHSECFSYIDYVFDEGTSCEACNNETEVTVINPVLIMVDWAIDDVLDNISSVFGCDSSPRSPNVSLSVCVCVCVTLATTVLKDL